MLLEKLTKKKLFIAFTVRKDQIRVNISQGYESKRKRGL